MGPREGHGRLVALLVLATVWLGGCGPQALPVFDRIVLVSFDTLRADHLGLYGYPRDTAPFLGELGRRGVVFERAYSAVATTAPSHASLFTSLYPLEHGVSSNGRILREEFLTLAERLRAQGFCTAGFASTRAHWQPTGLVQGFERFDGHPAGDPASYRPADRTVDAALGGLEELASCARLFLFLHFFDAHIPLRPPAAHLEAMRGRSHQERLAHASYLEREQHIPLSFFRNDPLRMLFIVDRYDAEIHFADSQLRRFQRGYEEAGLGPRTLWLITADHGEALGEHGRMGHGVDLYEPLLHVPLLLYAADGSLPARRVDAVVELVDVLPTLLELLGLEDAGPPLRGRSLLPLLRDEAAEARGAFAERRERGPGPAPIEKYSWTEADWKYIRSVGAAEELYELRSDPYETRNLLAGEAPPAAAELRARLEGRLASLRGAAAPAGRSVDAEAREELRALGYAE